MEQQCESFTELESKYFSFAPYDNDPDFTWFENREDECSSNQSESPRSDPEDHDQIKEQVNATSPKEVEDLSASYSKLPASLVTPGNEKAKVCRWDQQPWNGEKSNSDADEKLIEIIKRRQRLMLANIRPTVVEKRNADIPVKYPCDIYPSVKTPENACIVRNSSKSSSQPKLAKISEAALSRRSSPSSISTHNPWNGEKSKSDADKKLIEIITSRRRLMLANIRSTVVEKRNADIPVKYPCDIYPSAKTPENACSVRNSSKSSSQPKLAEISEAALSRRSSPSSISTHNPWNGEKSKSDADKKLIEIITSRRRLMLANIRSTVVEKRNADTPVKYPCDIYPSVKTPENACIVRNSSKSSSQPKLAKISEAALSRRSSPSSISTHNPWNGEKSKSDADKKLIEIITSRRRLMLANIRSTVVEKRNADIPVKYPCDIYPSVKTPENARSVRNSSKSSSQPKLAKISEAALSRRSSPSSISTHIHNSSRLSIDSCKNPCATSKENAGMIEPPEMMPCYKGYQLLGDNQLVRFSEQLLGFKRFITYTEVTRSRRIGYCVNGQKIKGLKGRILKAELPLSDKLILLIGTNDMVHNTDLGLMCEGYVSILNALKEIAKRIVILTVPPVPKLVHDDSHMPKLQLFNQFVTSCADDEKVFVVDLASMFISYSKTVQTQYFEQSHNRGRSNPKVDLIHLNQAGFKILSTVLDIAYFDKYPLLL